MDAWVLCGDVRCSVAMFVVVYIQSNTFVAILFLFPLSKPSESCSECGVVFNVVVVFFYLLPIKSLFSILKFYEEEGEED